MSDIIFNEEKDFEEAVIKALIEHGWESDVIRYPSEEDLIQNWANILFNNNKQGTRLNDQPLTSVEMAQILDQIGNCKMIIASRFHAMILGWIAQCKVLPLIYSDKMLNVINDVRFTGKYVDIKNIESLTMDDIMKIYENQPILRTEILSKEAERQFDGLKQYLNT